MQLSKEQLENLKEVLGAEALTDIIKQGMGANAKMEGVESKSEKAPDLTGFKTELLGEIKTLIAPVGDSLKNLDDRLKVLEAKEQAKDDKQKRQPMEDNRMLQTIMEMQKNDGQSVDQRDFNPVMHMIKEANLGQLFGIEEKK